MCVCERAVLCVCGECVRECVSWLCERVCGVCVRESVVCERDVV